MQYVALAAAILQLLQQSGLLQVFIDAFTNFLKDLASGTTPAVAFQKQAPVLMKLYAKLPDDKQAQIDQIILNLKL